MTSDTLAADLIPCPPKPLTLRAKGLIALAALCVVGVMTWAFLTSSGSPDPTAEGTSPASAIFDIGVLVFREGLECILVLAAITASMVGRHRNHRRAVALGAGVGAVATVITWFIAVGIVNDLTASFNALQVQAWTGLLAVVVLLVVMNWFFHKMYWGGWITMHNRKKKELLSGEAQAFTSTAKLFWGLGLLGFASFYREGFEVVLFLQSYNLKLGSHAVYLGVLVGLFLSGIVAVLTFVAHSRLPYRKMLELTGILLGVVLLVMVGEQAQEMQLAQWIPTTTIGWLKPWLPGWAGIWFSAFPTVETLAAQALAAVLVIGSFFLAKKAGKSGGNLTEEAASA